ncbi:MAG: glycosyltransferase, partial [Verrucomicrobiota bacterium]
MTEPLKITILIASLEQGGAQRMALRLFDGLEKIGCDVHFITLDGTDEMPLHSDSKRSDQLAQRVIYLSSFDIRRNTLAKIITFPVQWWRLQRCLGRLQSDTVISFMERANIFNLLSIGKKCRIICIRKHLSMAMRDKSWLKEKMIRGIYPLLLRRADNINFNAEEAAEDFRSLFSITETRTSVIYNYCDIELINRLAKAPIDKEFQVIFNNHPVIITSGRLLPVKGHKYLIRAFRKLHDSVEGVSPRLIILGEGPLRSTLTQLIADLQLQGKVHLPGFQENPYAWIGRSDIFVLPSLAEGFPNALMEAMALGIPSIAAACPSGPVELLSDTLKSQLNRQISDIIHADYGIIVPRLDRLSTSTCDGSKKTPEDFLYQALDELINDPEKRQHYSRQAKKKA